MPADEPELPDSVLAVAADTVRLLSTEPPATPAAGTSTSFAISGTALERLGHLLDLQVRVLAEHPDALRLVSRAVLETWITGHGALLLDPTGRAELERRSAVLRLQTVGPRPGPELAANTMTLTEIARLLDTLVYGATDPPRAFQRHVASFFDEIDISDVEGTISLFTDPPVRADPPPATRHVDHVRVSLWVVLFLAYDHYAAVGAPDAAQRARNLFDRLRRLTDAYYAQRRGEPRRSSS